MTAPSVQVRTIDFFERATPLRIPFKFGANTLTEAPQVFVRAEVEVDGRSATGQSAELLAPKWFDKNPALTNQQNFDQLRASLQITRRLTLAHGAAPSAFALHAAVYPLHYAEAAKAGLNGLIASYGMALIDRAVLDALCRAEGTTVFDALGANLPGITTELTPDLAAKDLGTFLTQRHLPETIWARHTVGMADPLTDGEIAEPLSDGLPQSLEAVIAAYGNRYFKIKVGADIAASIEHLLRIASVLDRIGDEYRVTMDGNEQFSEAGLVSDLFDRIEATAGLRRLWASTLFVEQPIARHRALLEPVTGLARRKPLVIDESDADLELVSPRPRAGLCRRVGQDVQGRIPRAAQCGPCSDVDSAGDRLLRYGGRPYRAAWHRAPAQPGVRRARRRRAHRGQRPSFRWRLRRRIAGGAGALRRRASRSLSVAGRGRTGIDPRRPHCPSLARGPRPCRRLRAGLEQHATGGGVPVGLHDVRQ